MTDRTFDTLFSPRAWDRASAGAGLSVEIDDDGIALVEFDQPDVRQNRFTPELLERLSTVLDELHHNCSAGNLRGVVFASAKRESFLVGVDIAAVHAITDEAAAVAATRRGQEIFQKIADLPVSTVAAINGMCLGGATEMALACTWRVAADGPGVRIGLPEVNLGIFPGFGGSQRLPRTISLERALTLILTGRLLSARAARRAGLVDALSPAALLRAEARHLAARIPGDGRRRAPEDAPWRRRIRRWLLEGQPAGRAYMFRRARKGVEERTGGHYPAPLDALKTVREGLELGLREGLALEAKRVGALIVSPVCRNLLGIFLSRQHARRAARAGRPALGAETVVGHPAPIHKLGVVGAGVMGGGIAQMAAYNRMEVRIKDVSEVALATALAVAYKRLDQRRRTGRLSRRDLGRRMRLISPTLDDTGFKRADLVIEAVVEDAEIKRSVLNRIESVVRPDAVIGTNTSSFTLRELGVSMRRPERLVGVHFFNPVHRMPLVEVARTEMSDPAAVATVLAFVHRIGKVPVVVADSPGLLVNRVLTPYLNEALLLIESGVSVAAIDRALERFGMPMGPLRLLDEIGLDIAQHVADRLAPVFADRLPVSQIGRKMCEAGRLGKKTGSGFYKHGRGKPEPQEGGPASSLGRLDRIPVGEDEIVDRCLLLMLNEACHALQDGVVPSARSVDLALVMGTGFAPFRGGIFRHADRLGVARLRDRMMELSVDHGSRFAPAALLHEVADGVGGFYDGRVTA